MFFLWSDEYDLQQKGKKNRILMSFSIHCMGLAFGSVLCDKDERAEYGIYGTVLLIDVLQLKMSTRWSDCLSPPECTHVLFACRS